MKHMKTFSSVLATVLLLAGCMPVEKWKDSTTQNRGPLQARQDTHECRDVAGYRSGDEALTRAKISAYKACMRERGWIED